LTPDDYEILFGQSPPAVPAPTGPPEPQVQPGRNLTPPPIPRQKHIHPVVDWANHHTPPEEPPPNHLPWILSGVGAGIIIATLLTIFVVRPGQTHSVAPTPDTEPTVEVAGTTLAAPTGEPSTSLRNEPLSIDDLNLARTQLDTATVATQSVADTPFRQTDYRPSGWPDTDGDCQNNKNEVLIAEARGNLELRSDSCAPTTARWIDPLDGTTHTHANTLTVSHLVPLAEAHRAGAWEWDAETRRAFGADLTSPATLAAISTPMHLGKGDRRPDQWRPPLQRAWCGYAIDWISVKTEWDLTFVQNEVDALRTMLATCEMS
jgi:hypothetical protein